MTARTHFVSLSSQDLLLNFYTRSWIFLCQFILHFEEMQSITLLQLKERNLKVGKEWPEDGVLNMCLKKQKFAYKTVSWQSCWLFYQYSNAPAHFSLSSFFPVMAVCGTTQLQSWDVSKECHQAVLTQLGAINIVILLLPYLHTWEGNR